MLTELNKEYLREMGIIPMGDIISILRHSKTVTDEMVRDKILSIKPEVPKVEAKVRPATTTVSSSSASTTILPAVRRVLPEHEGKYKISLPKGSTKKSRDILAKHSAMQSDKMEKKSIFERLNSKQVEVADSTSNESLVKASSIFTRLGNYKELEKKMDRHSDAFSGILKGSQKTCPKGIVKKRFPQRVLSKHVARSSSQIVESSSDSDDKMDSDELKQVSFSEDVEVRVFKPVKNRGTKVLQGLRTDGIKSRLGNNSDRALSFHTVKRISMKPDKLSPIIASKTSKMKSDNMKQQASNVHSRLDIRNKTTMQLANRIKQFKIDETVVKPESSSVFNRLGVNRFQ